MNSWTIFTVLLIFCTHNCLAQRWINTTTVTLNEIIDENMQHVRRHIHNFGFDPMKVPNISDVVYANILWTNQSVNINLTNGIVEGSANMRRAGNFLLTFLPKSTIRITAPVFVDELTGKFNYSLKVSFYRDNGYMDTTITNVTALTSFDIKLDLMKIINPKLHIKKVGHIHIRMHSNSYIDWLKSFIGNIAIPHYESKIVEISENTAIQVASKALKKINRNMVQLISNAVTTGLVQFGQALARPNSFNKQQNNSKSN